MNDEKKLKNLEERLYALSGKVEHILELYDEWGEAEEGTVASILNELSRLQKSIRYFEKRFEYPIDIFEENLPYLKKASLAIDKWENAKIPHNVTGRFLIIYRILKILIKLSGDTSANQMIAELEKQFAVSDGSI